MCNYNTPGGGIDTALDKFVYQYVEKGFSWSWQGNDILFKKAEQRIFAKAVYNDKMWICGFDISENEELKADDKA